MEGGDKGDIRMESGLFIFHISNCLLCLFVCYIKVPGFSWRPTFRCLSLERGGGQEAEEVYMEPKLWCSSLRNLVNTSYIHIKQTQHSFNLHIIHQPSAIHKMYSRWSKGREAEIFVCRQLELVHVSAASLYPGGGDAARVIVNILGIYSRASVICQSKHLVNLWQWIIYHVWLWQRICVIYSHFR